MAMRLLPRRLRDKALFASLHFWSPERLRQGCSFRSSSITTRLPWMVFSPFTPRIAVRPPKFGPSSTFSPQASGRFPIGTAFLKTKREANELWVSQSWPRVGPNSNHGRPKSGSAGPQNILRNFRRPVLRRNGRACEATAQLSTVPQRTAHAGHDAGEICGLDQPALNRNRLKAES